MSKISLYLKFTHAFHTLNINHSQKYLLWIYKCLGAVRPMPVAATKIKYLLKFCGRSESVYTLFQPTRVYLCSFLYCCRIAFENSLVSSSIWFHGRLIASVWTEHDGLQRNSVTITWITICIDVSPTGSMI